MYNCVGMKQLLRRPTCNTGKGPSPPSAKFSNCLLLPSTSAGDKGKRSDDPQTLRYRHLLKIRNKVGHATDALCIKTPATAAVYRGQSDMTCLDEREQLMLIEGIQSYKEKAEKMGRTGLVYSGIGILGIMVFGMVDLSFGSSLTLASLGVLTGIVLATKGIINAIISDRRLQTVTKNTEKILENAQLYPRAEKELLLAKEN